MAAPATDTASLPLPADTGGDLVAEHCGPHLLVRGRGEDAGAATALAGIPRMPGSVLVLVCASARPHPGLFEMFRGCLAALRSQSGDAAPRAAWLAVPDLGNDHGGRVPRLTALAGEFGVDVLAPHGPLTTGPGTGLFVDPATGGRGWRRFGPGGGAVVSRRFPVPVWENQLPPAPVLAAGLVTEAVPAGVAVRPIGPPPPGAGDVASRVPLNPRIPKLVVGGPGTDIAPAAVAEVINRLPAPVRSELLVVPAALPMTAPEWVRELARLLDRPVAFTTGPQVMTPEGVVRTVVPAAEGEPSVLPLATMLVQEPGGEPPHVLDVAPPPPGWQHHGARFYRPVAAGGVDASGVIAEVLPGGLHVRLESDLVRAATRFDPRSWTLAVGSEGREITGAELAATRELLDGLTPGQRRSVRIRPLGIVDAATLAGIEAHPDAAPEPAEERTEPGAAHEPPAEAPAERSARGPARPPVPVTAVPVPTVSGPRRPPPEQAPAPHRGSESGRGAQSGRGSESDRGSGAARAPESARAPEPSSAAEPAPPRRTARRHAPLDLDDRFSTPAERTRFAASAGARYTEALAAVNVAMSAWPMLRTEAKADHVAVCLYLGGGEGGAAALAASTGEPFAGYLQCLVSGLRRLPTHRRVVLRQARPDEVAEDTCREGALLGAPGFLTASTQLDITTSAGLDLLIWPCSARRTAELLMGHAVVEQAVFPAGRRFTTLAVRTEPGEPPGEPHPPRTALLLRELAPDEDPETEAARARDQAALPKLDRAWRARWAGSLRLVDDPDTVARLTSPLEPAGPPARLDGPLEVVS